MNRTSKILVCVLCFAALAFVLPSSASAQYPAPVVTYYAGPPAPVTVYYQSAPTVVYRVEPVSYVPVQPVPASAVYIPGHVGSYVYRTGPWGLIQRRAYYQTPGVLVVPPPAMPHFPSVGSTGN